MRGAEESEFARVIRESGLVSEGDRGVVMVSGGPDSVALLIGLTELLGADALVALHVNYGLRQESGEDEELVRRLCRRLGVELEVHATGRPEGNTQAWAREIRHQVAERIRAGRGLDWIAVGHTRSDQAETFLYRLAASPGVRPLLAMPPRSGKVIRPLLRIPGDSVRDGVAALPAESAEDASNQDLSYARNRIRLKVMPELEGVNPGVERNIARTRAELEEDEHLLGRLAGQAIEEADLAHGLSGESLAGRHPAIQRRMIRQMVEGELGRPVAVSVELTAEAVRLAGEPEGGKVDLGGGDALLIEAGLIRVNGADQGDAEAAPVRVDPAGGSTGFGDWELEATHTTAERAKQGFDNPWSAFLTTEGADPWLRVWRPGDRIEPLGMSGSKKLQDVFTDALIPASRRRSWPVLTVGETIIWVPGLVRSRHRLIGGQDDRVLRLQATPPFDP